MAAGRWARQCALQPKRLEDGTEDDADCKGGDGALEAPEALSERDTLFTTKGQQGVARRNTDDEQGTR